MRHLDLRIVATALALTTASGCAGDPGLSPFGYAEDRCRSGHDQCQTDCAGIDEDGPARSACIERCYSDENRCYALGDEESSLAVGAAAGSAPSRAEMERDFQRWKRMKARAAEEASAQREEAASPGVE